MSVDPKMMAMMLMQQQQPQAPTPQGGQVPNLGASNALGAVQHALQTQMLLKALQGNGQPPPTPQGAQSSVLPTPAQQSGVPDWLKRQLTPDQAVQE